MSDITPDELEIGPEDLVTEQATGATVIDVREPREYLSGHIPGALPVPMTQLSSRLGDLDRSRPLYVVCASGNRSAAMAHFLVDQGFRARSVRGGTTAWIASGRSVTTGPPAPSTAR